MFALNRANRRRIRSRSDKEYCVLATILGLPKNLYRTTQHDFTNLRTQVLKCSPPDRMEREVAPWALGPTVMRQHAFTGTVLDYHAAATGVCGWASPGRSSSRKKRHIERMRLFSISLSRPCSFARSNVS